MSPMQSLRDTLSMPRHLPTAFINGRYHCRTCSQVAPHTILGKWPTRRFVMAGREKKATPATNRRPQSSLLGSSRRPFRSHEDRSSFLELPFQRTSECACCIGLHYATRAAPPDPLPHHQEHDRPWHVSISGLNKHHHFHKSTWRRYLVAQQ